MFFCDKPIDKKRYKDLATAFRTFDQRRKSQFKECKKYIDSLDTELFMEIRVAKATIKITKYEPLKNIKEYKKTLVKQFPFIKQDIVDELVMSIDRMKDIFRPEYQLLVIIYKKSY